MSPTDGSLAHENIFIHKELGISTNFFYCKPSVVGQSDEGHGPSTKSGRTSAGFVGPEVESDVLSVVYQSILPWQEIFLANLSIKI